MWLGKIASRGILSNTLASAVTAASQCAYMFEMRERERKRSHIAEWRTRSGRHRAERPKVHAQSVCGCSDGLRAGVLAYCVVQTFSFLIFVVLSVFLVLGSRTAFSAPFSELCLLFTRLWKGFTAFSFA